MAKTKGPGGEIQFVQNHCEACGAETVAVICGKKRSTRAQWQCKANETHLFKTRKYTVTTRKG